MDTNWRASAPIIEDNLEAAVHTLASYREPYSSRARLLPLTSDRRQNRDLPIASELADPRQPLSLILGAGVGILEDINILTMHGDTGRRPRPLGPQDHFDLTVWRDL